MSARHRLSADYLAAHAAVYGQRIRKPRYRRGLLPDPLEYYRRHLHALRIKGDWASARCPFHEDRSLACPSIAFMAASFALAAAPRAETCWHSIGGLMIWAL